MAVRVIVTRPQQEAADWVARLQARGLRAQALPLIDIGPAPEPAAMVEAWRQLGSCQAVMFVSRPAVAAFLAARPPGLPGWPGAQAGCGLRAWAPGPGTAQALLDGGVPAACIDAPAADAAQADSEALWQLVAAQAQPGAVALIVRGGDASGRAAGRAWLAERLQASGATVREVVAYVRRVPVFGAAQRALASTAAGDGSTWLFASSQSLAALRSNLPGQSWGRARALATHPRIAAAVRGFGFGSVHESAPGFEAVVASIESLQ